MIDLRTCKYMLALSIILPVALWADPNQPEPGLAGVPGETGNCTVCHGAGPASVNKFGGSVSIAFPSGTAYTPGQMQKWLVTIADPSARRWGFQAAARLSSSNSTSAGGFVSTDNYTQVLCSTPNFARPQRSNDGTCGAGYPLMYVEQNLAGSFTGSAGKVTFAFNWMPPSTDVGPINVFISGNAANGDNSADPGDHIYTSIYTLTPANAVVNPPAVSANGVVNGAGFAQGITAGSWVTILGSNFTTAANCGVTSQPGCRAWTSADFASGTPTSLDGVSVSIGGKAAFIAYVSPTQINVLAPDVATGAAPVTVTNSAGTSAAVSVNIESFAPALFQAGKYAVATHLDGTLVASGAAAKRGEIIILWGTGFGPVSPNVPAGMTSSQALGNTVAYVTTTPSVTIGGVSAPVSAAALTPSALGLYQVVITMPDTVPVGDQPVTASAGGKSSPASGVLLAVK